MNIDSWLYVGYFVFAIILASVSSRALAISIVYAIGLLAVAPNEGLAALLTMAVLVGYLLAQLRD